MPTTLSAFVARISESSWLAALIIVPILFNPYTERFFEEDKIPLMRSTALIVLVALLIFVGEQINLKRNSDRPWWKVPLVVPTLFLTAIYLVATAFSVEPRVSLWGAYLRLQGTYTWLSYIIIFFGVLLFVREQKQIQRIITIILLTSVPVTLYAFLQNNGLDPIQWQDNVVDRVRSTIGNPILVSAYLIMVVPLTIMRIIEHFRLPLQSEKENEKGNTPNYLASSLLLGAYLFLLIIQLMSIVYSQSRGPLLALLIGMAFFALFASVLVGRWLTLIFIGLIALGIAFLVLFNLPNTPLEPLRQVPYLGRLGSLYAGEQGGIGSGRPLIWQNAIKLLANNPVRNIVGYGPDAMYIVYEPYFPSELEDLPDFKDRFIDRSHNQVLDSLIMTGVLGFGAEFILFLSLFYYFFKWLGFIGTARQRYLFMALIAIGGLGGTALPYFIEGSFRFFPIGLPVGIMLALMIYLLVIAVIRFEQISQQPHRQALLLITLFAVIMAHFIEIQFGIAFSITRLYFWLYAALIVVIGLPLLRSEITESTNQQISQATQKLTSPKHRRKGRIKRRDKNKQQSSTWMGTSEWKSMLPSLSNTIVLSLMMSLLLMVMTFNFYIRAFNLSITNYSILWLFLATWLYGALIIPAESSFEQENEGGWLLRLATYAAVSLGMWAIFCLIYMPWVQLPAPGSMISVEELYAFVSRMANAITVLYVFVFLIIILAAVAGSSFLFSTGKNNKIRPPMMQAPAWLGAVYALLFILIVPLTVITNLNVSRADTFNRQGTKYEVDGQLDVAIMLYETAVEMQKYQEYYRDNLYRATLNRTRMIEESAQENSSELLEQP